jgi:hypothetical protein
MARAAVDSRDRVRPTSCQRRLRVGYERRRPATLTPSGEVAPSSVPRLSRCRHFLPRWRLRQCLATPAHHPGVCACARARAKTSNPRETLGAEFPRYANYVPDSSLAPRPSIHTPHSSLLTQLFSSDFLFYSGALKGTASFATIFIPRTLYANAFFMARPLLPLFSASFPLSLKLTYGRGTSPPHTHNHPPAALAPSFFFSKIN